jgi:hypothetical protein
MKFKIFFLSLFFASLHFAKAASISSKISGNWSSTTTWNGGVVPGPNDDVTISLGNTVLLDVNTTVLSISVNGTLNADQSKDLSVSARYIMVHGAFNWGSELNPYTRKGVITLTGSDKSANIMGMGTKMIGVMGGGTLRLHGQNRVNWTMLNQTAAVNATSIVLQDAVDWNIGEEIIITTTGREHDLDKKLNYTQTEKRTITAISSDRKTISLDKPLQYLHYGSLQTYTNGTKTWTLDERAEVGLLTRNLKVQGDASSETNQFGGHIMSMDGCKAYLSGVELFRMGQAGLNARYPFHWHLTNDVKGQFFKGSSVHHSFQRAVTVHAAQNATVQDNVMYDILGHAIFLEDGNETGTLVKNNLISYVHKPDRDKVIRPSDVFNLPSRIDGPSGIWVSHPTNDLVNNAVSSCGTGIWYALLDHPDGPSFDPNVRVNNKPLGNVDGNRTHSCYAGFMVDFADVDNRSRTEAVHYHCPAGQVVKNATSFHCLRTLWWRGNAATFENAMTANPYTHQGGNVFTFYGTFKNSLMVGHSANKTSSSDVMMYGTAMYDGNHELVNCHFENFDKTNQAITTMIGGASKNLPMTMENCTKKNARVMHLSKTWDGNPEEQNTYSSLIWDKTGQILGAANRWSVLNHPFLTDNTFTKLDAGNDIGGAYSNNPFARLRFVVHDITEQTKTTLYAEWADGHQAHNRPLGPHWEMAVMPNSARMYRFRMTDYTPKKMTVSFGQARVGDKIRFFIEGMPQSMNVVSHNEWPYDNKTPLRRVFSQADYNAASDNVYYWDGSRAFFQLIARYSNDERTENILITSPTGSHLGVAPVASRPFMGQRWGINSIVQAEDFDHGGQGVAYFEKRAFDYLTMAEFKNFDHLDNRQGEMVDLSKMSPQSTNYYISDIKTNEWWNYSFQMPTAGTYTIKASMASSVANNQFRILVDGLEVGRKTFAASDFSTHTFTTSITRGNHTIRVEALTDGMTFDWLSVQNSSTAAPFVNITKPTENQKLAGVATFEATASNDNVNNGNGIASVVFTLKLEGVTVATFTDNTALYQWNYDTKALKNGSYELTVTARNTSNVSNTKVMAVNIENPYDCAGVLNGTAFVDACGKCTGGNTGKPLCSDTLWDKGFQLWGWAWGADVTFTQTDETIEATSTGGNRHFWSPDNVFIPTEQFRYFHVRMKNPGTETMGRISWFRADGTNAGHSYPLSANKTAYVDYVIDLSTVPNYNGLIKRLLFQPTQGSNIGTSVSIDRIEFSRIDRRDCNGVWRGTAYKDQCNACVGGNTGKTSASGCDGTITIVPYFNINRVGWKAGATANACPGDTVSFGPHPVEANGWSWTGPNGFKATTREIRLSNITTLQAGNYVATFTNAFGNKASLTHSITLNPATATITSSTGNLIKAGQATTLTANAGNTKYVWYKSNLFVDSAKTSISVIDPASYTVRVTNSFGCRATSSAFNLSVDPSSLTTFWHFNNGMEGWNTFNQISFTTSNSLATGAVSGGDPYMYSPNLLAVSATDYPHVLVGMQNLTSSNTAELFWARNDDGNFNGTKRVSFPIVPNDTKVRYYLIDLSANAEWKGLIKQLRLDPTVSVTSGSVRIDFIKFLGAYPSNALAVPGTIQIEDFNKGGQGNAYFDADAPNNGSQYRSTESVDIELCAEGGFNIGWTAKGEWMEYLVNVSRTGFYDVLMRLASATNSNAFHLELDGETIVPTTTVNTLGGLQQYFDIKSTANLLQGKHVLKFVVDNATGGFNLNKLTFAQALTTNLQENTLHENISVFPNPAQDLLTIRLDMVRGTHLEIINLLGEVVYRSPVSGNEHTLSVADFASGVYVLKIDGKSHKIMVGR